MVDYTPKVFVMDPNPLFLTISLYSTYHYYRIKDVRSQQNYSPTDHQLVHDNDFYQEEVSFKKFT